MRHEKARQVFQVSSGTWEASHTAENREANLTLSDPRFCLCLDSSKRSPHRHMQSGEARRAASAAHRAPARLALLSRHARRSVLLLQLPQPTAARPAQVTIRRERHPRPGRCQNPPSEQAAVRLEATFCCRGDQSESIRTKIPVSHDFSKLWIQTPQELESAQNSCSHHTYLSLHTGTRILQWVFLTSSFYSQPCFAFSIGGSRGYKYYQILWRSMDKVAWIQDQHFCRIAKEDNNLLCGCERLWSTLVHAVRNPDFQHPYCGFRELQVLQQNICHDWIKGLKAFS